MLFKYNWHQELNKKNWCRCSSIPSGSWFSGTCFYSTNQCTIYIDLNRIYCREKEYVAELRIVIQTKNRSREKKGFIDRVRLDRN